LALFQVYLDCKGFKGNLCLGQQYVDRPTVKSKITLAYMENHGMTKPKLLSEK